MTTAYKIQCYYLNKKHQSMSCQVRSHLKYMLAYAVHIFLSKCFRATMNFRLTLLLPASFLEKIRQQARFELVKNLLDRRTGRKL